MYVEILHRKKSICVFAVVEQGTLYFGTHLIVRHQSNLKKKKILSFVQVKDIFGIVKQLL